MPTLLLLGPGLSLRRQHAQQHGTKGAEGYCASHEQAQQHVVHSPWDGNYEHGQGYKGHLQDSMHRQIEDCRLPHYLKVQGLHLSTAEQL